MSTELKEQLNLLMALFPPTHERFRITRCSMPELCCVFVAPDGKTIAITGTIMEPSESAVWYTETDDQQIADALSSLSETSSMDNADNALLTQVHKLIAKLCSQYGAALPSEASKLQSSSKKKDKQEKTRSSSTESAVEEITEETTTEDSNDGIPQTARLQLRKVINAATGPSSSNKRTANQRLWTEYRELVQSNEYKRGDFSVELYEENMFRWRIKVKKVDPDSALAKDLATLKTKTGQDFVEFDFAFGPSYPFSPPIVAVVSPRMVDGHVAGGGAICLELLTNEGWRCAYTVEMILVQVISVLCGGNARVQFNCLAPYDVSTAAATMTQIAEFHKEHGWKTPPKKAG